jgi:hypothetical protein
MTATETEPKDDPPRFAVEGRAGSADAWRVVAVAPTRDDAVRLAVDALCGYGATGEPATPAAEVRILTYGGPGMPPVRGTGPLRQTAPVPAYYAPYLVEFLPRPPSACDGPAVRAA